MKTILFSIISLLFFNLSAQEEKGLDYWSVGVGLNNTIMHGDLTSVNNLDVDFFNTGFYIYIDKMITPALGFEFKGQSLTLKGFSQELSLSYPIEYTNYNNGELYFNGDSFGGELNFIINLNGLAKNPYLAKKRKFNFSTYFGVGYHTYNSELFSYSDLNGVGFSYSKQDELDKSSIYYTTGLGIRYNLNKRLDIELRQNVSFNSKDDLDAAVTRKQVIESFFTTQLGLVVKLNKRNSQNVIWDDNLERINEKNQNLDDDGDGVVNRFDIEENTPKGAKVYGNGVAIDSDKDGIIDFYDKCPLVVGIKEQKGCPIDKTLDTDGDLIFDYLDKEVNTPKGAKVDSNGVALDTDGDSVIDLLDKCPHLKGEVDLSGCPKDSDGDNIYDIDDLCPTTPGNIKNKGCPNVLSEKENIELVRLAKNIYFESGKYFLRESAKRILEKAFIIMEDNPGLKFIIEGHTDSGGKYDYNMKLSQDRVNSVKKYLVRLGIDAKRLKTIGYGFTKPLQTNNSSKGRQLNRRVEIIVDNGSVDKILDSQTYIIKGNDTLFSISQKYNITVDQLKTWNRITNDKLTIGDRLIIK